MNRRQLLATLAAGTGTALAGCASDGPGTATTEGTTDESPTTAEEGSTTATDGDATVRVRETEAYGDVLVGAEGMSLYLFDEDNGTESTCYDGCAQTWPPLTVEDAPTAGSNVTAELGTTERDGGATQVTAGGYPLYYYAGDGDPGDTNGQGVGDIWWLLAPDGTRITGAPTTTESETTDGGGYY